MKILCASLAWCAIGAAPQHSAAIERAREGRHPEAWDAAAAEPDALLGAQARVWVAWSAGDLFGARRELRAARAAHPLDPTLLEWQLRLCSSLRDAAGAREALDALGGAAEAEMARAAVEELAREELRAGDAADAARLVSLGAFAASLLALFALARTPR